MKRGICTNKGNNSKLSFTRIMPLFGLAIFSEILFKFERDQRPYI